MGKTDELLSHNVYAYCANNPVMRVDSSGAIFDAILDIVFCVVDVVVCIADPSVENHIALAADLACLAMPFVTDFKQAQNGLKKVNMNNGKLLDQLRGIEQGLWKKVYQNGWDAYGNKISIHYCQSKSGQVFDLWVKKGWS